MEDKLNKFLFILSLLILLVSLTILQLTIREKKTSVNAVDIELKKELITSLRKNNLFLDDLKEREENMRKLLREDFGLPPSFDKKKFKKKFELKEFEQNISRRTE